MGFIPERDELIVFGGVTATGTSSETWVYSLGSATWERVSTTIAPSPRAVMSYATYTKNTGESYLVVAHGTRRGTQVNNEIWAFSARNRTWAQLPSRGDVPHARYGAFADIYPGTDLFIFGQGFGGHRYSNAFAYDLTAQAWLEFDKGTNPYNPSKPHARCLTAAALVAADKLVMYGGCMQGGFTGGTCPSRDTWVGTFKVANTDDATATARVSSPKWRRVRDNPSPRNLPAMTRVPAVWGLGTDLALLIGGEEVAKQTIHVDHAPENVIEVVDVRTRSWLTATAEPASPGGPMPGFRSGAAVAVDDAGGRVFMYGGNPRNRSAADARIWHLTVSTGSATGNYGILALAGSPAESFLYIHLHGLFMGLAWGVLLPAGVMVARHLRHRDPLWFKLHRAMQVSGVLFTIIGFILVFVGGATNPAHAHGIIGLLVVLFALFQPVNAFFRPHKGMRLRAQWEWLHKGTGWAAVVLGLINVSLGVLFVVGPNALWIAWFVILCSGLATAGGLEVLLRTRWRTAGAQLHMQQGDNSVDKSRIVPKETQMGSSSSTAT